ATSPRPSLSCSAGPPRLRVPPARARAGSRRLAQRLLASVWPGQPTTCTSSMFAPASGRRPPLRVNRPRRELRMPQLRSGIWWSSRAVSAPRAWLQRTCMCSTSRTPNVRAGT
ncbi:hypothetical protein TSOC_011511, partial [Tetrabaena socialis]